MYCHKCGANIHKESHFCSNCAAKVETVKVTGTSVDNRRRKLIWLLPAVTFFIAFVVIGSFFLYETRTNSEVEALVQEGEAKALEGNLLSAKATFEQVLQKRPKHTAAAFNIEVVERGQRYEVLLDQAASFSEKKQLDEGLLILDELELELAEQEGPFFDRLKEQSKQQIASLTVASVNKAQLEKNTIEEIVDLLEKIKDFTSEEAKEMDELLKRKLIDLAINQGETYLKKNQFTEAEIEFDRGLSYDPTNEKLLTYKETVKKERITFKQAEQKRLENATDKAAEEDHFNSTKAVMPTVFEFNYDEDEGELSVWGEVKNVGTRPINEIDIHYTIFDKDGNELENYRTSVSPYKLMPNEIGYFEGTLLISETVGNVEMDDYDWVVE
ncbi:FxLYD domain-containing protein [Bacillaceae bacterium IKA-2]|nr:FxLYD domain-containing protein [Bacillaceae bacterium IKA-2]